MKSCKKKYLAVDYFFDELSADQKIQYESHLDTCEACQQTLADLEGTATLAKQYRRQQPDKKFLKNYHDQLQTQFVSAKKTSSPFEKLIDIFFRTPSIPVRLAQAVALLLLGIFIGRNVIWKSDFTTTPLLPNQNSYYTLNEDLLLKNYLQEAEMVLLDVSNLNPVEDQKIISNLIQSTKYIYLLQKTILLKDQASELENFQLMELLNQIELILLEIYNLDEHAPPDALNEIKQHLKRSYLLMEIKSIAQQDI